MTPANETRSYIVTLNANDFPRMVRERFALGIPQESGRVAVWTTDDALTEQDLSTEDGHPVEFRRYLDRFILGLPLDGEKRETFVKEFFDWLAPAYDQTVDRPRNIQNIEMLVGRLLEQAGHTPSLILDFGCGTGLSIAVPGLAARLVGFDPSPHMRGIAASRGMAVWGHAELAAAAPGEIKAAFASYVLHNEVGAGSLALLAARMPQGGVFSANFHKGRGELWAENLFHELGLKPIFRDSSQAVYHGVQVVYRKG